MSYLFSLLAWVMALFAPAADVEAAKCAACVTVAYASLAGGQRPEPQPPAPEECCTDCGGTGWVKTPEGFRTPCPCPADCKCKQSEKLQ